MIASDPRTRGTVAPSALGEKGPPNTIASIMDLLPRLVWFYDETGRLRSNVFWTTIDGTHIDTDNGERWTRSLKRVTPALAAAYEARVAGKGATGDLPKVDDVDVIGGG